MCVRGAFEACLARPPPPAHPSCCPPLPAHPSCVAHHKQVRAQHQKVQAGGVEQEHQQPPARQRGGRVLRRGQRQHGARAGVREAEQRLAVSLPRLWQGDDRDRSGQHAQRQQAGQQQAVARHPHRRHQQRADNEYHQVLARVLLAVPKHIAALQVAVAKAVPLGRQHERPPQRRRQQRALQVVNVAWCKLIIILVLLVLHLGLQQLAAGTKRGGGGTGWGGTGRASQRARGVKLSCPGVQAPGPSAAAQRAPPRRAAVRSPRPQTPGPPHRCPLLSHARAPALPAPPTRWAAAPLPPALPAAARGAH